MTNEATRELLSAIQDVWPLDSMVELTSLVAISGGPDSVALARLLEKSRPVSSTIILAHYNHRLRGEDSNKDETFVRELAEELGFEVEVGEAEETEFDSHRGQGLESLARQQRYQFLMDCAKKRGARFVLTAHTLDDQVETVLQRIFRGTGIRGLAGIKPAREWIPGISLVRPLLGIQKKQLADWLLDQQATYRLDQSNESDSFTRNRIRHELLPLAHDIFENDVTRQIIGLSENAQESMAQTEPAIEAEYRQRVQVVSDHRVTVNCSSSICPPSRFLVHELFARIWIAMSWPLQQMTRDKWNQLGELMVSPDPRKINLPGNILAQKEENLITIWDVEADPMS